MSENLTEEQAERLLENVYGTPKAWRHYNRSAGAAFALLLTALVSVPVLPAATMGLLGLSCVVAVYAVLVRPV